MRENSFSRLGKSISMHKMIPHTVKLFLFCVFRKVQTAFLHYWLKSFWCLETKVLFLWRGTQRSRQKDLPSTASCTKGFTSPSFQNALYLVLFKRRSAQAFWSFMLHMPLFYTWKSRPVFSQGKHSYNFVLFRNKQEIRKALALNGLVLTRNWNTNSS